MGFEDEKTKGSQAEKKQKARDEKELMRWQKKALAAIMKKHKLWEAKQGATFRNGIGIGKQEIDNVKRQIQASEKVISAGKVNVVKNREKEHNAEARRAIVVRGDWEVLSRLIGRVKRMKTGEARDHKQKGIEAENLKRKIAHAAQLLRNLKIMHAHMFRKHRVHAALEIKREKIKLLALRRRLRRVNQQVAVEAAQIAEQKRHVESGLMKGAQLSLALGRQRRSEAVKNARLRKLKDEKAKKVKIADLKFARVAAAQAKEKAKLVGQLNHQDVRERDLHQKLTSL